MRDNEWKYYNHAMVSTKAPHENVNMSFVGGVLKQNKKALFQKWTSNFDCEEDTGWYYVIREKPFIFDKLSKGAKSDIRRSLKKCYVKKVDPEDYFEDMQRVSLEARERYRNSEPAPSFEVNSIFWKKRKDEGRDFFIGFEAETNRPIGYVICMNYGKWVNFEGAKYSTEYLKLRISDALNVTILNYYLNECDCDYICDGERSIYHETGFQDYLIRTFGYKKANCQLNIKYRVGVGIVVKVLYPFRKYIKKMSSNQAKKISAVLLLEEINRYGRQKLQKTGRENSVSSN